LHMAPAGPLAASVRASRAPAATAGRPLPAQHTRVVASLPVQHTLLLASIAYLPCPKSGCPCRPGCWFVEVINIMRTARDLMLGVRWARGRGAAALAGRLKAQVGARSCRDPAERRLLSTPLTPDFNTSVDVAEHR
jgi:hypothetical protein